MEKGFLYRSPSVQNKRQKTKLKRIACHVVLIQNKIIGTKDSVILDFTMSNPEMSVILENAAKDRREYRSGYPTKRHFE